MKRRLFVLVVTVFLVGALAAVSSVLAQDEGNGMDDSGPLSEAVLSDDSVSGTEPEVIIPDRYLPTDAPGNSQAATVYFTPQDENTSTTVLFLYNTSNTDANVDIQTFLLDGSIFINTTILVPAHSLVRICGDTVSSVSATWQNVVLVNFTTNSTYGLLNLPDGVKAEAYVVWNNSSTYDPLQIAPTLNIRFSTDPANVFLPTINRD